MAHAVPSGTHANVIDAINRAHQEAHASAYIHNDRPPRTLLGADDVLAASPTTFAEAVDVFNNGMGIHNRHLPEFSTSPEKYKAHKANDTSNLMGMTALSSGATYEATQLALVIALLQELSVDREAHRTNGGGIWHASVDTTTVLGTTATMTTWKDCAERANLLKALDNAHYADVTAHGGTTTSVSSANATEGSIDSIITLTNELRTRRGTHLADATAHGGSGGADVVNTIALGAVTGLPSVLATFAADFKTKHNAHLASTTYHNTADATYPLTYGALTTFSGFITAAQEVYTNQRGHQFSAPASASVRI